MPGLLMYSATSPAHKRVVSIFNNNGEIVILPFLTPCNFLMKKWDLSFCGAAGFYIYTVSMNLLHFEILAFVKISFFLCIRHMALRQYI